MSIDNEMERVARIVAADRDLKVDVRGVDAYSVPGRIVIPSIESFDWLGKDAKRMMHGLLDHEAAHAKYTDHSQMAVAKKHAEALGRLLNSIEDGWIERRIGTDYPGARQNLEKKNRWFWEREEWQSTFAKEDRWSAFVRATTLILRGSVTLDEVRAKRKDVAEMIDEIPEWMRKAYACNSTRAALGIAKGIYDHFTKDEPPPPPPPPLPPSEGDEEGESEDEPEEGEGGDGEASEGDGDAEGDEGEPGDEEGEGEASGGDAEPEPEKTKSKRMAMKLSDWKSKAALNPEEAIKVVIDMKIENGDMPYIVFSTEFDHERDFYANPREGTATTRYTRHIESIERVLDDAHTAGDALAGAFEAALRARREKHPVAGSDEGDIDEAMLAEFAVGAAEVDTIYRQMVAIDDRDVAVAILIDCSGSMVSKAALARRSAAAISLALTRCQIAHEITGFTTVQSHGCAGHPWFFDRAREGEQKFAAMRAALIEAKKHGRDIRQFAREVWSDGCGDEMTLQAAAYAIFKPYDIDELKGLLHADAISENLDGEAVLWQARRLARRPEPRRVMFVLSDGYPAGHLRHADGRGYLKDAVKRVTEAGIEVYGIGMMSEAVREFYPRYWVARDMAELTNIAFGSLVEVLTEARDERACVRI